MTTTPEHDQRMANMSFASVFPHYVSKIERKGRTIDELYQIIEWLTGFTKPQLHNIINENITFAEFFDRANLHPNASLIKGSICGYKIEDIQNPITRKVRYLDKVVDELAKGKKIEKIMQRC